MSQEDRAQELELLEYIRNNRAPTGPTKFAPGEAGYGPAECDECGEEMPPERRAYGFTLCCPCKEVHETIQRRRALSA